MLACINGREDIVSWLLMQGANVHYRDSEGCSPLRWASMKSQDKIVDILINAGANVNDIDNVSIL